MKKKKKSSLSAQMAIAVIVLIIAANAILGFFLMNRTKNVLKAQISERMLDLANTAAAMIDGDDLEKLTPDDKYSYKYKYIEEILTVFQDNINLEYIYCIMDMGDGNFVFGIDPSPIDPGEFGSPITYTDALYEASLGIPSVDDVPYTDDWGSFYSAYSPVFDSEGEVAGIVAVDFSSEWYDSQIRGIILTILLSVIISLVMGGLIVFIVTSKIRRRFKQINSELSGLSSEIDKLTGDLDETIEGEAPAASEEFSDKKAQSDDIIRLSNRIHSTRGELQRYVNHLNTREKNMITALASDYRSVYYVDLDEDTGVCYRSGSNLEESVPEGETFVFSELFGLYADKYVADEYKEEFRRIIDPAVICEGLKKEAVLTCQYLAVRGEREMYEMLRVAGVRHPDGDNSSIHEISIGITDVDRETRESLDRNRALSEALAVANESSKAKTAFLSNMSHEIRTPMNAIIGLDTIALSDPDISDKTHELLSKIGISANHLLTLINDILDMSRIESGRMTLKKEEFLFLSVIEQVNTIIGEQCKDKNQTYICKVDPDIADYYIGDDTKLKQVLINILGNAVKFTPDGGEVELSVERLENYEKNTTLRFAMRDTGIGMDKEYIPHIFEAFSQEDSSYTTKLGSTGLGMAITKRIVEMMNGDIQVESEKGVGTTFYVTVTLRDSSRTVIGKDSEEFNIHDYNILVIEAEGVTRACARMSFDHLGVNAGITNSCEKAMEIIRLNNARNEPYNLIIVDRDIADYNGAEAVEKLRSVTGASAVFIIVADGPDDLTEEEINAGIDGLIFLPIHEDKLVLDIKQAVCGKRDRREHIAHKTELKGRTILLAEDMPINAEIMTMILDMREMKIDVAENGRIAVEKFSSHPAGHYSAILMDMRMPEMDGLTATTVIRTMDRPDASKIPIIALTANAFDEDVQRSLQVGLNAHLSKPVDADKLFSILESIIDD